MELTLDQALQKGIEAHKAGKVEEADRCYTAILKSQPKHPDANHNMGVLAVGVGKVEQALPFFKTALEGNASTAQYWLSYIDALIKLDRMVDAKAVFDQLKSKGAKGDGFDQIEKRLGLSKQVVAAENSNVQNPPKDQLQVLINLYTQGQYQEALDGASKLLKEFPNSVILYNIIGTTNKSQGKLEEAVKAYKRAINIKPNYAEAYNNLGNARQIQGKLDEAIEAFKKALFLKSDNPEVYYNLGNALQDQGKLEEAVESYNKAILLKPDYALSYNNLGNTLQKKARFGEAIEAYKQALSIKPDHSNAYFNLGNVFQDQGKLGEAIEAYNEALSIVPDNAQYWNNIFFPLRALRAGRATDEELSTFYPRSDASDYAKIALSILDYKLHRGHRAVGSYFDQALTLLARADNITIPHPTFDKSSNNQMPAMPDKMVALVHFGRSGTGLLHSLIDGHPSISTLPSIYFSEYFDHFTWERIIAGGREEMVDRFISIYEVLFDASSVVPIETKSKALKYKIGIEEGMANVGDKGDEVLTVDKEVFRSELNCLIDYHEQMDASTFFRLVHVAFDKAINDQNHKRLIFYHIHNPDTSAKLNFVRSTPHSNWIVMVREPVQSCESWLRKSLEKNSYTEIANKILNMLFEIDDIVYKRQRSVGVRLEDLKRRPRETIPALCNWMGIEENEQLYQMTAQGKKWWGDPSSPDYSNDGMDPFGKTSIDRKVGSIFSKNDQFILRTLFYPFSVRFGYTEENEEQFRNDLREIRPKIDEMFDFEKRIAEKTMINFEQFTCSGSYLYLRSGLIERWNTLNEFNTYPDMIEPLKI